MNTFNQNFVEDINERGTLCPGEYDFEKLLNVMNERPRFNSIVLYLAAKDKKSDIRMYIDSPGGSVSAGLSVLDTMNFIAPDVSTVCMGTAALMGAVLLCGGAKGKRFILPHGQVMIHQPLIGSGGLSGQCSDIKIHADNLVKMRTAIEQILSEVTGQNVKKIHRDCDRDNYFSASEAVEYGLCDKIITKQQ